MTKRARARKAMREASGAVGRLIDAAEALEPTKARGEVTSRAKWLLTAITKLEIALSMAEDAETAGAEAARSIMANRPTDEPVVQVREGRPLIQVLGEGVETDDAPMPHFRDHGPEEPMEHGRA